MRRTTKIQWFPVCACTPPAHVRNEHREPCCQTCGRRYRGVVDSFTMLDASELESD